MKESRKPFHYLVVDVLVNFARNIIFSKSRAQKLGIRFRFEIFLLVFRFPLPCLHVERKNKENISNQTTIHRLNTTIQWTKKNFFVNILFPILMTCASFMKTRYICCHEANYSIKIRSFGCLNIAWGPLKLVQQQTNSNQLPWTTSVQSL